MPIHAFSWEGQSENDEDVVSKCISANPSSFSFAAGLLLDWAAGFPDTRTLNELDRSLTTPADDLRNAVLHIARQLMKLEDGCNMALSNFRLRANTNDPCLVEQSFDGGLNWIDAFRLDACGLESAANLITTRNYIYNTLHEGDTLINNLIEQYDGDVTNIYPQATYDMGSSTENDYRNIALCYAISRATDTVCDGFIAAIDANEKETGIHLLAIGAAVGIFVLLTIATAGTFAIAAAALASEGAITAATIAGLGAGVAVANWVNNVAAAHSKAPFQDMAARDMVKCYWYNQLKDMTITDTLFADALNDPMLGGAADIIADSIDQGNEIPEQFVSFLNLLQQSYAAASVGIISFNDCPCEADTWIYDHNFSDGQDSWLAGTTEELGTFSASWTGSSWQRTAVTSGINFGIRRPVAIGGKIKSVQLFFTIGQVGGTQRNMIIRGRNVGETGISDIVNVQYPANNTVTEYDNGALDYTITKNNIDIVFNHWLVSNGQALTLTRVRFEGEGNEAFV